MLQKNEKLYANVQICYYILSPKDRIMHKMMQTSHTCEFLRLQQTFTIFSQIASQKSSPCLSLHVPFVTLPISFSLIIFIPSQVLRVHRNTHPAVTDHHGHLSHAKKQQIHLYMMCRLLLPTIKKTFGQIRPRLTHYCMSHFQSLQEDSADLK